MGGLQRKAADKISETAGFTVERAEDLPVHKGAWMLNGKNKTYNSGFMNRSMNLLMILALEDFAGIKFSDLTIAGAIKDFRDEVVGNPV